MSYEPEVHEAQTSILRALLFAKEAGFAELQKQQALVVTTSIFISKSFPKLG